MVVIKGLPAIDGVQKDYMLLDYSPIPGFYQETYRTASRFCTLRNDWVSRNDLQGNTLCGYYKNIFQNLVPLLGFLSDYYIEDLLDFSLFPSDE